MVGEAEALREIVHFRRPPLQYNPPGGPVVAQVNAQPGDLINNVLDGEDDRWLSSRRYSLVGLPRERICASA